MVQMLSFFYSDHNPTKAKRTTGVIFKFHSKIASNYHHKNGKKAWGDIHFLRQARIIKFSDLKNPKGDLSKYTIDCSIDSRHSSVIFSVGPDKDGWLGAAAMAEAVERVGRRWEGVAGLGAR
jgi:hypothetical protein